MHSVVAASALPLLLGAALSDWAYMSSHQVQWTNFASWLVAGGLVVLVVALLWAAGETLLSRAARSRRRLAYLALLFAGVVLGLGNSLVHARDGWAAMPAGLLLSIVVLSAALAASVLGLAGRERKAT